MKHCIKLLAVILLASGMFSAFADSGTDRYMAGGGTSVAETREGDQQSGPRMSVVQLSYGSPCFGVLCDPSGPSCTRDGRYCNDRSECGGATCSCIPRKISDPTKGGSCR